VTECSEPRGLGMLQPLAHGIATGQVALAMKIGELRGEEHPALIVTCKQCGERTAAIHRTGVGYLFSAWRRTGREHDRQLHSETVHFAELIYYDARAVAPPQQRNGGDGRTHKEPVPWPELAVARVPRRCRVGRPLPPVGYPDPIAVLFSPDASPFARALGLASLWVLEESRQLSMSD
jgi:hypothetical protein